MVENPVQKILELNDPSFKKTLRVIVHSITPGKDGKLHITVKHPMSSNYPSLIFEQYSVQEIIDEIINNNKQANHEKH